MKQTLKHIFLVVATAVVSFGIGQPAAQAQAKPQAQRPNFQELIKRFDRDGDGRLNEQERRLAQEEMRKRSPQANANRPSREEIIKRFDKNGDGRLDAGELATLRREMPRPTDRPGNKPANGQGGNYRALLERFDVNKNGRLDPPEQARMREQMRLRQQGKPQPRPDQPRPAGTEANRQRLLQRFDANGNGQLDPDEQQKAQQAVEEFRRRAGGNRGNTQGLKPRERKSRLDTSALLEKYDTNKNGTLDADERRAAMEAMRVRSGG